MILTHGEPAAAKQSTARAHFAESNAVATRFFSEKAERIAQACQSMAMHFQMGGRLLVCGRGAQRSDVSHVVVEFLHPVVVGKRALPAIALARDTSSEPGAEFASIAKREDILLVLCAGALHGGLDGVVASAAARGVLTVVLRGNDTSSVGGDHVFAVPSDDVCIVQETHEVLYHILWELTHVFLDHRGSAS